MRTVFLGSPPFATPILERLVSGSHRPICVVTQPERRRGRGRKEAASPVAEIARREGIELLQPEKATDAGFQERLRELGPDVFFVVAYGKILREEFLAIPRRVSLNVHPSLLPLHRGATPIQAALLANDAITGVTIQRVSLELDAGDVLIAEETPIDDDEDAGSLGARLAALSAELSERALELVASGEATYTPQDHAAATFCRKLEKGDGALDWSRSAPELRRHVRGMTPWPGATTTLPGGAALTVTRVGLAEGAGAPGEVLEAKARFVVACGAGGNGSGIERALELQSVKPAGKRAMSGEEFLRGARVEVGSVLGGEA